MKKIIVYKIKRIRKKKIQILIFIVVHYNSAYVYSLQTLNQVKVPLFCSFQSKPPSFTIGMVPINLLKLMIPNTLYKKTFQDKVSKFFP